MRTEADAKWKRVWLICDICDKTQDFVELDGNMHAAISRAGWRRYPNFFGGDEPADICSVECLDKLHKRDRERLFYGVTAS